MFERVERDNEKTKGKHEEQTNTKIDGHLWLALCTKIRQ